jgi:hypothetical protein
MNNQTKKFSFLIELSNTDERYEITLNNKIIEVTYQNQNYYEFDLDITKRNTIKVIFEKLNSDSYLQIKNVAFNNTELYNLDMFSLYHAKDKVKKTYGWMDESGTYTINVHGNPLTQNLLTYLLSKKE